MQSASRADGGEQVGGTPQARIDWDSSGTEIFSCDNCHLEPNSFELVETAGLEQSFEVEGDPASYDDEPEYNNE